MSGPTGTCVALQTLEKGSEVKILAERLVNDDELWYQVELNRRTGWVRSVQVLKEKKEVGQKCMFGKRPMS